MVKKKGGREMNPMDSHRKAERARQLARNKKERQLQREAMSHIDDPSLLRKQLKEILEEEEELGSLNATQRSRKKTLQRAYDAAIRRQMEVEAKKKQENGQDVESLPSVPVSHIPLPAGMPPLPPGKPPDIHLPPPSAPPPGMHMPPHGRTIGNAQIKNQCIGDPAVKAHAPVISAKSTVVPLPKAHHDKKLTSLVPASVQASRPSASHKKSSRAMLVPRTVASQQSTTATKAQSATKTSLDVPDNFDDFMNSLKSL